ncbi:hypothetical protein ScPMuIL_006279 [Solemya velum]
MQKLSKHLTDAPAIDQYAELASNLEYQTLLAKLSKHSLTRNTYSEATVALRSALIPGVGFNWEMGEAVF